MIRKILIANRGEIAIRVMRACYEMGIRSVAVFSEADRTSRHVLYANEAECIGPAPSNESYLCIEKIIDVAKKHKVDAIHPGYGFLSENAEFARRCEEEGIIFIGPKPQTMIDMGDKIQARRHMIAAGVPVVPGTQEQLNSSEEAIGVCKAIGFPVMIKASMGGGGKGMRLVHRAEDVVEMYQAAKSEAMSGFGDDTVYIEKYVEEPHHIELMGQAAVAAAKAVNYEGAGTIEFLVDKYKNFYFLEMNTRLQVEHPITEEVIGLDLVKQQIFIAEGRELSLKQEDIRQRGHAIECRICAEDTDNNFRPAPGIIQQLTEPHGPGIRIDSAVYPGYEIPMYYDPMIGKLIVWATTRQYAIERMRRALYEYKVTGLVTNIRYLRRIIDVPQFKEGNYDTSFIEVNQERLRPRPGFKNDSEDMAIIASYIDYLMNYEENTDSTQDTSSALNRWRAFGLQKGVLRV